MISALVSNVALGLDFCAKTTELILRIYFPMKAAVVRHETSTDFHWCKVALLSCQLRKVRAGPYKLPGEACTELGAQIP